MSAERVRRDHPRLPASARVADAAAMALALLAIWIIATGGGRYLVGDTIISLRSPMLALYAAISIVIVRHLRWPRPTLFERLRGMRAAVRARPDVDTALRAFVVTRPAVLVIGFLAVVTFGVTASGFVLSRDPLVNLPARFDAGWYGGIAIDGYEWDRTFQRQQNIAFFPALPILMRVVGTPAGVGSRTLPYERRMVRALWAGVIVSLAAFFWALLYMSRLGRDLVGDEAAAAATLLLAAYPFALFFSAPYTESLFLLSALGAFYHYRRAEWVTAALWGLVLGLTRPNGCFASVPLAVMGLEQVLQGSTGFRGVPQGSGPAGVHGVEQVPQGSDAAGLRGVLQRGSAKALAVRLAVAAMPGIGMLLFTLYLHSLTGVWFAWARSHEAWGRSFHGFAPFVTAYGWLTHDSLIQVVASVPFNSLNTAAVLFALALIVPVFRRLGLAWGLFVLINLVPPLFAGGVLSMGRLTSTLFPLFLALATLVPPRSVASWCVTFGLGQGLAAALFFSWRELF